MRGCDDSCAERNRRLSTDPVEASLFDQPEQLGLQRERHVPDLVEEQRAHAGTLRVAEVTRLGAGEGALLMAEYLAFHKFAGNGGAIDGHEGSGRARRYLMQQPRRHLLARAGLAGHQHRQIVPGIAIKQVFHMMNGRRHAKIITGRPIACINHPPPCGDPFEEFVHVERLGQEVDRAHPHETHCLVDLAIARHEHEWRRARAPGKFAKDGFPGHVGKTDIADHQIDCVGRGGNRLDSLPARLPPVHRQPFEFQPLHDRSSHDGIILDQSDACMVMRHAPAPVWSTAMSTPPSFRCRNGLQW